MTRPFRSCGFVDIAVGKLMPRVQERTVRVPFEGVGDWVVTPHYRDLYGYNVTHRPSGWSIDLQSLPLGRARLLAATFEAQFPRIAGFDDCSDRHHQLGMRLLRKEQGNA